MVRLENNQISKALPSLYKVLLMVENDECSYKADVTGIKLRKVRKNRISQMKTIEPLSNRKNVELF